MTDAEKRDALRARGWHEAAGSFFGAPMWRRPWDACIVCEESAFAYLDALPLSEDAVRDAIAEGERRACPDDHWEDDDGD